MNLTDAVVIVTGSGTGVGAACVRQFAAKGARVVVNYSHSRAEAEETAGACAALGAEVMLFKGDVSDDSDCRTMVKATVGRWGRLDALVNNAAITKKADEYDLESLSAQDFHDVFAVNVIGTYQMIRAAEPALRATGAGAIVNVSSIVAMTGGGSSLAYGASKGAINVLTLSLARILGPEIRVNAVCPTIIDTRWMGDLLGEEGYAALEKRIQETTPLAKVATADEVADAIVWLVEGAGHVTGELLCVDGGVRLAPGLRRPPR
jgi:NAD(P)-dependent dehydrogenase (short-subunit alcohol dehydrogenase family)